MGSNSIPQKTLSDESINQGLVCAHMHFEGFRPEWCISTIYYA